MDTTITKMPINPLRQRMLHDMMMRSLALIRNMTISGMFSAWRPFWAALPIRRRQMICAASRSTGISAVPRRLFLTRLMALHHSGKLGFCGHLAQLADRRAFLRHLSPVRKKRWVVYAKPPFGGPEAVLAYLSRYTHRVAISNRRLIAFDKTGVTLRYKDYRRDGPERQ